MNTRPLAALAWLAACSGEPTAAERADEEYVRVPHDPFPQMQNHGVPPLTRVQVVTVTFAGSARRASAEAFGGFVVGSRWLQEISRDFGPVSATHLAKVVLPAPAATDDFAAILSAALASGAVPSAPGAVYLMYAPDPCGGGGRHGSIAIDGGRAPYAIVFGCDSSEIASHELAEILTDPWNLPLPDGGFLSGTHFDADSAPWVGEAADVCNASPLWTEGGFRLVPSWSNLAAASGGSPCVPYTPGRVYYNVSPSPAGPQLAPAGGRVIFTLTGWSTAPVLPWPLRVTIDVYGAHDFNPRPSLSASTIGNGERVFLTASIPRDTPSGARAVMRIHSGLDLELDGSRAFSNDWPVEIDVR